jgi:hypothetical protein
LNTPTKMSEAQDTQAHGNASKVAKPDLYHGDRAKLEEWLLQMDLYFKFAADAVDDEDKVSFVTTYMRGDAHRWIKPYLTKYLDDNNSDEDITMLFEDYARFKTQIRQVFGVSNEDSIAARAIQHLKQKRSAAEYATEFQHYAIQTNWDDKALKVMYRQGLKNNVKAELMRSGAALDTLEQLYQESIRIDGDLHELAMETRGNITSNYGKTGPPRYFPTPRSHEHRKNSDPYGPRRMEGVEFGNIEKGKGRARKQQRDARKASTGKNTQITCYGCGKPGHIIRNCRQKVTRQVNVLTDTSHGEDDDDDGWEVVTSNMGRLMIDTGAEEDSPASETEDEYQSTDEQPPAKRHKTVKEEDEVPRLKESVWAFCTEETTTEEQAKELYKGIHQQRRKYETANRATLEEESDKENQDPRDEYPHSARKNTKGKGRRSRAILEERLRMNQPNWVDDELEAYERKNPIRRAATPLPSTQSQYNMDYRNPKHALLSWTACYHDHCTTHYSSKTGSGWFPSQRRLCKFQWYDCMSDACAEHLWDKRARPYFPGKDDPAEMLKMNVMFGDVCAQPHWQTCLHTECMTHKHEKEVNGFDTQEKSFLGQRLIPIDVTDGIATPPTRND